MTVTLRSHVWSAYNICISLHRLWISWFCCKTLVWMLQWQHVKDWGKWTEGSISTGLHVGLCHLQHSGTSFMMLFIYYSCAFENILPDILILDFPTATRERMKNFLSDRPQNRRIRTGPLGHSGKHWLPTGLCAGPFSVHHLNTLLCSHWSQ